ncbi:MAG: ParA family protein [Acidobacteriota bacterium]
MKTLALANQKGGVGKTTTAINLGAALGALEKRVLVVDCDPQGNASRGLGCSGEAPNLYDVLVGEAAPRDVVKATGFPFLDVLPTDRDLVALEVELAGEADWQPALRRALEPVLSAYDFVLIDCPPSLGHLTIMALTAAEGLLVPLQCEYFALEGISELMATLERVRESVNPQLKIAGIVFTMFDHRTNLARDVVAETREHFGARVCDTIIPRNVRLAEAPSHGMPILQYDIKSRGAQAYLELATEVLRRGE